MRAMLVLAVGWIGMMGCGNSGSRADRETEAAAETRGSAENVGSNDAGRVRNACELASAEEIGAFAGQVVTPKPGRGGRNYSTCLYWAGTPGLAVIEVEAYFRGGQEAFETYQSAMGMAADLMQSAENVELDSIVKPGPVPGLGDAAVFAELGPSVVLDGDRYLELMLFHLPDARAKFRPLAELLLSRM